MNRRYLPLTEGLFIMRMTYKFAVYCLSILLIADFILVAFSLLYRQGDGTGDLMGQGIMTTYSIAGLSLLTILGVLFLVSYFRRNNKSIEILAWLMIVGNSFVLFGFLSFLVSTIVQNL